MAESFLPNQKRELMTIGTLTALLKALMEETFDDVYTVGEISNFTRSKSGHCYLTLKDPTAQISTVIWRGTMARSRFELKNGLSVLCRGRIEVYPPHGKYQLIVSEIEPVGVGSLERAFRQLHAKLEREGLFASSRKRALPRRPRRIALVTSPTGAAVRDFLNILRRRARTTDVLIVPAKVQGESASKEIADALTRLGRFFAPDASEANRRLDAVVLIRGGGSMEDLWPFNEEQTVRALAACPIPTVTGIGHEIDVTLSDLAADLHALTPSDAAARLIPDDGETLVALRRLDDRLIRATKRTLDVLKTRLDRLARTGVFLAPSDRLLSGGRQKLDSLDRRLDRAANGQIQKNRTQLAQQAAKLEALSPLAVLARGYSLTETESGRLIRSAAEARRGEKIVTRLTDGKIISEILETE